MSWITYVNHVLCVDWFLRRPELGTYQTKLLILLSTALKSETRLHRLKNYAQTLGSITRSPPRPRFTNIDLPLGWVTNTEAARPMTFRWHIPGRALALSWARWQFLPEWFIKTKIRDFVSTALCYLVLDWHSPLMSPVTPWNDSYSWIYGTIRSDSLTTGDP